MIGFCYSVTGPHDPIGIPYLAGKSPGAPSQQGKDLSPGIINGTLTDDPIGQLWFMRNQSL